jgi:hypothetical protein
MLRDRPDAADLLERIVNMNDLRRRGGGRPFLGGALAQHTLRPRREPREPALLSGTLRRHSGAVKRQADGRISADDGASRRCAGTTASAAPEPIRSGRGGAGLGWGGAGARP